MSSLSALGTKIFGYGTSDPHVEAMERLGECLRTRGVRLLLSSLSLSTLPDGLAKLEHLVELNLSKNMLSFLPDGLTALVNLRDLYINQNRLVSLEPVFRLPSLAVLDASANLITELKGESLAQARQLQVLRLDQNQLDELPSQMGDLANLRRLSLRQNRLLFLPPELARLHFLTEIELDGNPLRSPPLVIVRSGTVHVMAFLRGVLQEGRISIEEKRQELTRLVTQLNEEKDARRKVEERFRQQRELYNNERAMRLQLNEALAKEEAERRMVEEALLREREARRRLERDLSKEKERRRKARRNGDAGSATLTNEKSKPLQATETTPLTNSRPLCKGCTVL